MLAADERLEAEVPSHPAVTDSLRRRRAVVRRQQAWSVPSGGLRRAGAFRDPPLDPVGDVFRDAAGRASRSGDFPPPGTDGSPDDTSTDTQRDTGDIDRESATSLTCA